MTNTRVFNLTANGGIPVELVPYRFDLLDCAVASAVYSVSKEALKQWAELAA